jgi:predicted small lipoprotein YifL
MRYFAHTLVVLLAATTLAGCGDDDPIDVPTQPTPVAVTETFTGTLTVNGAVTHRFSVDRAGTVSAQVKTLSEQAAVLGVSLGTFNGADHRKLLRLAQRRRQARCRRGLLDRRHALLNSVAGPRSMVLARRDWRPRTGDRGPWTEFRTSSPPRT